MRKLASVQRIIGSAPIEGADRICTYFVQGWQSITQIGKFKEGDLAVFLEIDSVPPNQPAFAWLWEPLVAPTPSFRIRTKKLKGVVSQGVLFAFSEFPEHEAFFANAAEGDDVTELLGVTKYEIPVKMPGIGRSGEPPYGAFAADVPKTDEDRLQGSMGLLGEMKDEPYIITEKCDGTSVTFAIDADGMFRVYGRNWEIKPGDNPYWKVARDYNIHQALVDHPELVLQGELVGPGIQKNRLGLKEFSIRAFTLFSKKSGERLGPNMLYGFCDINGIPLCRVVERGDKFEHSIHSLLALAEGKYEGTSNEREGIVVRPMIPKHSRILGGPLSFKVISNRYLLKGGEDD